MIICLAQTSPVKGNLSNSIDDHKVWIQKAVEENADCIFFSELSITGYEPTSAKEAALSQNVVELIELQEISNQHEITICVGVPIQSPGGVTISMVIFMPNSKHTTYSKQHLHSDETRHFNEGDKQELLMLKGTKVAPAICYESLQEKHLESCLSLGAEMYMSSVAKPENGILDAHLYFANAARKYKIPIAMTNCVGIYDGMNCTGQSAVWDNDGTLVLALNQTEIGLIVYNTKNNTAYKKNC